MNDIKSIRALDSLQEVIGDYDAFIIDQFGVLHDGQRPYPKAVATLQMLMRADKRVIILSNSGKRSDVNIERMKSLGFARSLFTEFVTSGDVAFAAVNAQFGCHDSNEAPSCLLISRDGDKSAVEGLAVQLTDDASKAQLVVISASEADKYPEQHYIDLLREAAEQQTPCLCTNPDKLMITAQGIKFGAGRIAELYESLGGTVQWFGKPYPDVYEHCVLYLKDIESSRVLCIGDSLEHDIAGGAGASMKTLLIRNGIHREMSIDQLTMYMHRHQAFPDYQMQELG